MKRRFLKLVLVFIIGLFASNNVSSQEVNMNKWIDLKVEQGAEIDISLAADTSGVRALVKNGYSERYIYMYDDLFLSQSYTFYAYDTIIRIFGDVSQIKFRETNFQLNELNFDNNTDVRYLDCTTNGLNNINLRPLPKLEYLALHIVNRIEYIDASNLSQLLFLSVSGDKLRELNIEGSINIETLLFYYTLISNIDLRG